MARREAGLDKDKIPPWQFTGFNTPGLSDDVIWDSWREHYKHGTLLVSGGYLDQPGEWWDDMGLCDAMYNTLLEQAYDEAERLKPNA